MLILNIGKIMQISMHISSILMGEFFKKCWRQNYNILSGNVTLVIGLSHSTNIQQKQTGKRGITSHCFVIHDN